MDLSDTITVTGEEEGTKELCTSSHTLLINLSEQQSYDGGATRLFLAGNYYQVRGYDRHIAYMCAGHSGHQATSGVWSGLPTEGNAACGAR